MTTTHEALKQALEEVMPYASDYFSFSEKAMHVHSIVISKARQALAAANAAEAKLVPKGQTTRKAFICKSCEGVYADQPVTQCDCMPDKDEFIKGIISYPAALPAPMEAQSVSGDMSTPSTYAENVSTNSENMDMSGALDDDRGNNNGS